MNKILFIDWHNAAYRNLHVAYYEYPDDYFTYWKYLMVNSLYSNIMKFNPSRIIIAIDSSSWRKALYADYKVKRKDARKASPIDYDKFYKLMDDFTEEMKEVFSNIRFVKISNVECDDIIAVLIKQTYQNYLTTIVSTDKDFVQLLENKNVTLYDPNKKEVVKSMNPKKDLELKIIGGDKSDNIPAILPKTGPVKAAKLYSEGVLYNDDLEQDIKDKIYLNRQLIDFDFIPKTIQESIINNYSKIETKPINYMNVMMFFSKLNSIKVQEEIIKYIDCFKNIT